MPRNLRPLPPRMRFQRVESYITRVTGLTSEVTPKYYEGFMVNVRINGKVKTKRVQYGNDLSEEEALLKARQVKDDFILEILEKHY